MHSKCKNMVERMCEWRGCNLPCMDLRWFAPESPKGEVAFGLGRC